MVHHKNKYLWLQISGIAAALATVTAIVYWPSLSYDFQFDDIANISKHFNIRHNTLSGLFFSGTRWISYWMNAMHYQIGQFNPFSYRLANVILHTCNGLLVFGILTFLLTRLRTESFFKKNALSISSLTSLLFLLHPVQTQTVSYVIQGQLEGMALFSILTAIACFIWIAQIKNNIARYACTPILLAIGFFACGTKEITIVLPALVMLIDWFFIAQGSWQSMRSRLPIHGALCLTIIGGYLFLLKPEFFFKVFSLQYEAQNNFGNIITEDPRAKIMPLHFLISQFKVILHYLWIFIWPLGISVEYDWKLSHHLFAPDSLLPLLALIILAYGVYRLLKKNSAHPLAFGALWFALAVAPRSTIIASAELMVDYKTYIPSLGWLFMMATGIIMLWQLIQKKIHYTKHSYAHGAACLLLTATLGGLTVHRNTVWRSGLEFWGNIIANAPGKARAYNNYGVELSQKMSKFEESVPFFQRAIAMDQFYTDPMNNLAVAYSQLNKVDAGIEILKKSLTINPHYPEGYNNLASFFLQKKDYEMAEKCLKHAIKLRPYYGKAYFNLGRSYFMQDKKAEGWEFFKKACTECDFDNTDGYLAYAKASMNIQKFDVAIDAYKKILQLDPHYPDGEFNLANAYFMAEQYDQAHALYSALTQRNPHDGRIWFNDGETMIRKNNIEQAITCFNNALRSQKNNPHVYMRLATCYEKIGNPAQAKQILHTLRAQTDNQSVHAMANSLLDQINMKHKA